jgi:hypothetical protein
MRPPHLRLVPPDASGAEDSVSPATAAVDPHDMIIAYFGLLSAATQVKIDELERKKAKLEEHLRSSPNVE